MHKFVRVCVTKQYKLNNLALKFPNHKCNKSTNHKLEKARRSFSNQHSSRDEKPENFNQLIARRRTEAQQSILVQVNSEKSYEELHSYCAQFGQIRGAYHYSQNQSHYILLEYESKEAAQLAIKSGVYSEDAGVMAKSHLLWFRAGPKNSLEHSAASGALGIIDGNERIDDADLNNLLQSAEKVEDQIVILHRATQLNDIGVRLRFMAAYQMEQSISGIFPYAQACPFGSSVNGFGKMGCDLDLILRLSSAEQQTDLTKRLVFHTKENLTNSRFQQQRQMENLSDMLQMFLPGVCHVRRILQARIPIIKYHHDHLDLEVDLSMSNLTGFYMSELLYMFSQIDVRVQPLVFCIRRWAKSVGLTNQSPGRWISNFSLTCLVIFYLQQLPKPILPSINHLVRQARPEDYRCTEDHINCTFVRDLELIAHSIVNNDSLTDLLLGFFEFYSQLNFADRAISLNDTKICKKPDHSPMYIINPLESTLNVTKNVSLEECERFRIEVRNAAWTLESCSDKVDQPWGLLSLFKTQNVNTIKPNMFFKQRLVDVRELFSATEPEENAKTRTPSNPFKNGTIKAEIGRIQRKHRADIEELKKETFSNGSSRKR